MSEKRVTSETGGQKCQKLARLDLISSKFLWGLSAVCGFGALKYSDDNWRKGYSWRLSYGALQRHLHLFWHGQEYDDESDLHHLLHAAWHCMVLFIFSTLDQYQKFDDRPGELNDHIMDWDGVAAGHWDHWCDVVAEHEKQLADKKSSGIPKLNFDDPLDDDDDPYKPPVPCQVEYETDPRSEESFNNMVDSLENLIDGSPDNDELDPLASDADTDADIDDDWDFDPASWQSSAAPLANTAVSEFRGSAQVGGPVVDYRTGKTIVLTETVLGHLIEYISSTEGYIDGEWFHGTAFVSRVSRWKRGFETVDDEITFLKRADKVLPEYYS